MSLREPPQRARIGLAGTLSEVGAESTREALEHGFLLDCGCAVEDEVAEARGREPPLDDLGAADFSATKSRLPSARHSAMRLVIVCDFLSGRALDHDAESLLHREDRACWLESASSTW